MQSSQQKEATVTEELLDEIRRLKNFINVHRLMEKKDYWVWMEDENNHIESMSQGMVVAMQAHTLKGYVDAARRYRHLRNRRCETLAEKEGTFLFAIKDCSLPRAKTLDESIDLDRMPK